MKTPMNEPITMFKKQFNFLSMAVHPFPKFRFVYLLSYFNVSFKIA